MILLKTARFFYRRGMGVGVLYGREGVRVAGRPRDADKPGFLDYGSRSHPAGSLGDPKDLGEGKVRPPRSFPLAGLALRMTGSQAGKTQLVV